MYITMEEIQLNKTVEFISHLDQLIIYQLVQIEVDLGLFYQMKLKQILHLVKRELMSQIP